MQSGSQPTHTMYLQVRMAVSGTGVCNWKNGRKRYTADNYQETVFGSYRATLLSTIADTYYLHFQSQWHNADIVDRGKQDMETSQIIKLCYYAV